MEDVDDIMDWVFQHNTMDSYYEDKFLTNYYSCIFYFYVSSVCNIHIISHIYMLKQSINCYIYRLYNIIYIVFFIT